MFMFNAPAAPTEQCENQPGGFNRVKIEKQSETSTELSTLSVRTHTHTHNKDTFKQAEI